MRYFEIEKMAEDLAKFLNLEVASWYANIAHSNKQRALLLLIYGLVLLMLSIFFPFLLALAVDYDLAKPDRLIFAGIHSSWIAVLLFSVLGIFIMLQAYRFYKRAIEQNKIMEVTLRKLEDKQRIKDYE